MPALSQAQRKLFAIAEHNPSALYKKNRGIAKLPRKTLHDFAATKGKLPKRLHKKKLLMDRDELVREHSSLIKVLKSGKGLGREAMKQAKELKEYRHKKHFKHKVVIDNNMKDMGQEIDHPNGKHTIKINMKAHRHNKKELLDTLHEEKYHALHPKATEKTAKKATRKAMKNMTPAKARQLMAMLPKVHRKTAEGAPSGDDTDQSIVHLVNSLVYNAQHINGHTQQALEVGKKLNEKLKTKPEFKKHIRNLTKRTGHDHASS